MEIFDSHQVTRIIQQQYSIIIDDTTPPFTYIGKAAPGSLTSEAKWQIRRVDETTGSVFKFANGDDRFNNIWDDRIHLSYS